MNNDRVLVAFVFFLRLILTGYWRFTGLMCVLGKDKRDLRSLKFLLFLG